MHGMATFALAESLRDHRYGHTDGFIYQPVHEVMKSIL